MIIFLSELQKEHLNLLHGHSPQVVVDFCKLVIDHLNNGINHKKYSTAAVKLDMQISDVQNLIQALAYLLVDACHHNLSEPDFKSSLAVAGLATDHQEVLLKLYATKKVEIAGALHMLHQRDPTYQDFTWRFEVQMASRMCSEQIKPMVSMDFVLMTAKNFTQNKDVSNTDSWSTHVSTINLPIQDAKNASQCQNMIQHVLLQCDLPNLIHMTNKLEEAMKESKSQHVRKVQRVL